MKNVLHFVGSFTLKLDPHLRLLLHRDLDAHKNLRRAAQKCADRNRDKISGRENENGCSDTIAVERNHESSESPHGEPYLRSRPAPLKYEQVKFQTDSFRQITD
jgi:hypothetical protein